MTELLFGLHRGHAESIIFDMQLLNATELGLDHLDDNAGGVRIERFPDQLRHRLERLGTVDQPLEMILLYMDFNDFRYRLSIACTWDTSVASGSAGLGIKFSSCRQYQTRERGTTPNNIVRLTKPT